MGLKHYECLGWWFGTLHFTWLSMSECPLHDRGASSTADYCGWEWQTPTLDFAPFLTKCQVSPRNVVCQQDFVHNVCSVHLCGAVNQLLIWKYSRALSQKGWWGTCCPDHGQFEWPLCQQSYESLDTYSVGKNEPNDIIPTGQLRAQEKPPLSCSQIESWRIFEALSTMCPVALGHRGALIQPGGLDCHHGASSLE